LEADAGHVPLRARRFDLAISECGASLWCDPARWIPEAARILRPGGRLVFHTTSVLLAMCQPGVTGYAGQELLHSQREVARLQSPGHGIQLHPSHSEWIKILRAAGFTIMDALGFPVAGTWFSARPVADGITLVTEPHVDSLIRANFYHVHGSEADLIVDTGTGIAPLAWVLGGGNPDGVPRSR
jgi:SAM-dependent methyltransferase